MSDVRSSVMGGSYARPADASARIQFRRALTLTAMTLVMPGSAQLVMGNKRVGRISVRDLARLPRRGAVAAADRLDDLAHRPVLAADQPDAAERSAAGCSSPAPSPGSRCWSTPGGSAGPLELARKHRLWMTGLNAALCFVTAGAMLFAAHMVSASQSRSSARSSPPARSRRPTDGRYNVLLLGGDSGPDRSGVRPDSLTVASIDADTGRTVLVGLPRNLQDVPFPQGSVMGKQFPKGFDCEGCYLNAVNTWANDHADMFGDEGARARRHDGRGRGRSPVSRSTTTRWSTCTASPSSSTPSAASRSTSRERTAIGGIGSPIRGYIEPGKQKLTGDQALWYSRSRVQNNDFSRMGRQKCVMNAMLQQLSPQKVLLNVGKIADSGKALLTHRHPAAGPRRLHGPRAEGQGAEDVDGLAGPAGDLHRQPRLREGPPDDRQRDRQGRGQEARRRRRTC